MNRAPAPVVFRVAADRSRKLLDGKGAYVRVTVPTVPRCVSTVGFPQVRGRFKGTVGSG
jgi:hypothetical protein